MTVTFYLIALFLILLLAGAARYRLYHRGFGDTLFGNLCTAVVLAAMLGMLALLILLAAALPYGLYTTNMTPAAIIRGIQNSPEENELPDDLSGKIIIYYRFGCSDCEALYEDLSDALFGSDFLWVSTRSRQGKALRSRYPVQYVPSGVYISTDGTENFTHVLYGTRDGIPYLNYDAVNRLIELQNEQR